MKTQERLLSLDVLRGLDLMLLVGLQPVLCAWLFKWDVPFLNDTILYQLDHAQWEGLRLWDMVMPLFLFMSGATMPFSLPKYRLVNGEWGVWKRILKRFVLLYLLGMLVQGNLLAFNPERIYLFSNTLQAIAVGYLFAAPITLYLSTRQQLWWIVLLMVVYSVPMHLWGDWSPHGNFACWIDNTLLGRFRDGAILSENGEVVFASWYDYTWIWSSLTFTATVALGSYAGRMILDGNAQRKRVAFQLCIWAIALLSLGLFLDLFQPIIKRIWTASFVLFSTGWCYLLLALFYWWIDVKGHRKGWQWLLYYGCNAITAYLMGELINFRCIIHSVSYGLEQYLQEWYSVWLTFGNFLVVFLLLRFMYHQKWFLKV